MRGREENTLNVTQSEGSGITVTIQKEFVMSLLMCLELTDKMVASPE